MDNNKNTFIAIGLMLGVWVVFTILFPPQQTEPPVEPQAGQATEQVAAAQPQQVEALPAVSSVPVPVIPSEEKELVVRTDLFTATFTNIGARLKHLELNSYRQENSDDSALVSMINVNQPHLATLRLAGINGLQLSTEAPYSLPDAGRDIVLSGPEEKVLVFSTRTTDGLTVEKQLTIRGDSYAIDLDVRVVNSGQAVVRGGLELSLVQVVEETVESDQFSFTGGAALIDDELKTATVDELKEKTISLGKNTVWSAYEDKYFISALVPIDGAIEKVRVQRLGSQVENVFTLPFVAINPGMTTSQSFMAYFGPRDKSILESVNHDLARAIDFGFFSVIADPLLWFMNLINQYVHNYGIAIILLTVLIKLLFWPLTHKSYASMKSMQKLQPEIQKLKERFKNDRARQGQETMELYKKHRVNPMSGCLPMIIQIPVFFALYRVLYEAIELRHADFAFWLTDLSAKDPYYITPLIMGATMFIQQKMTPSTMDPMQQKIFLLMPVIFTVLFLNFPSGLVIYWLINNLLTIAQQYYIHKKFV